MRQAIDQVEIHGVKPDFPHPLDDLPGHLERLDAMHGFLHHGIIVLDPHGAAVEADLAQRHEMVA